VVLDRLSQLGWHTGGIGETVGLSGYLWATNCLGLHGNEGYAPPHHQDIKHFLRLHIEADGTLTVYLICVDRVARKWILCPDAPAHAPWFSPLARNPSRILSKSQSRLTLNHGLETPRLTYRHHEAALGSQISMRRTSWSLSWTTFIASYQALSL
jgi:hypothetical protein